MGTNNHQVHEHERESAAEHPDTEDDEVGPQKEIAQADIEMLPQQLADPTVRLPLRAHLPPTGGEDQAGYEDADPEKKPLQDER